MSCRWWALPMPLLLATGQELAMTAAPQPLGQALAVAQPWPSDARSPQSTSPPTPPTNRVAVAPTSAPADCAAAQAAVAAQASRLLAAAPGLRALLLGEIHNSAADHAWQLASLEALAQRGPPLVLGLEMVPAARQAALDRYSSGELDEQGFLQQVGWAEVWGHDPDLYLPLLRWARLRGVPLLALNAEPALVRQVRKGGLAALPPGERLHLGVPAAASPAYRQQLERSWRGHRAFAGAASASGGTAGLGRPPAGKPSPMGAASAGAAVIVPPTGAAAKLTSAPAQAGPARIPGTDLSPSEAADLQRFIDSQLLRDRAMAAAISTAQRRQPRRLVVALIGRGHLNAGSGVPQQLEDLGLRPVLSLSRPPLPEGCVPAPRGARLGAYLESEAGAVWVRRVAPGSAAEKAGLRVGDRILSVNGQPVNHAGQVIRRVRLQPEDEPLWLGIERAGRQRQLRLDLPPRREPLRATKDNGPANPFPVVPFPQSPA